MLRSASMLASQYIQQLLFIGRSLNMQSTSDQALSKMVAGTRYMITSVVAVAKTGGTSVACAGGLYTSAAKGGNALIGAAQSWVTLTAVDKCVQASLSAIVGTDAQSANTLYLSLTTGSTAACTADIFVFGVVLD